MSVEEVKSASVSSGSDINKEANVEYRRGSSFSSQSWAYPWYHFGGKDRIFVTVDALAVHKGETLDDEHSADPNAPDNIYTKNDVAEVYKPIEGYEGAHRFDPTATWSPEEEKKLVRRVCLQTHISTEIILTLIQLDWKIASWACFMFFALQLDRGNIGQALSDNLLTDLKMTTNDYNNGQTIFFCTFLFAELPSQLISKRIGPDNWIPIQMISWSIVALSQFWLTGRASFFVW
jgi:hypothetical protein